MGHDHHHGPSLANVGARHSGRLLLAFVLIAAFFVVEAVAGFLTNSLSLLSDAGHMLTDVVGLGLALVAIQLATRQAKRDKDPGDPRTFGLYRLEVLAAFVNAILLFGVAIYVLIEAVRRLQTQPEVLAGPMLTVAVLGLLANLVAFFLLREGARESINVEGAYLEVIADTIGSAGVILAAILLQVFGWAWVDPVIAALIGLWILPRTWHLGRKAVRILTQVAPPDVDLAQLRTDLAALDGVMSLHDLHVWTLTSGMESASAHLVTDDDTDPHTVLAQARALIAERYHIDHATIQVERADHTGCEEATW